MKERVFRAAPVLFLFGFLTGVVFAQWEPGVRLTFNNAASYTTTAGLNGWCVAATPSGMVHVSGPMSGMTTQRFIISALLTMV